MTDLNKLAHGHPLDSCECGDYRRDHENGTGPCKFNRAGFDECHANENCTAFVLSEAHIGRTDHE